MAEASPTVLAHVAWMLRGTFEDLSTEALAYILNRSDAAAEAFSELLQEAGADISRVNEVWTQVVLEGGEIPDLVCLDGRRQKTRPDGGKVRRAADRKPARQLPEIPA